MIVILCVHRKHIANDIILMYYLGLVVSLDISVLLLDFQLIQGANNTQKSYISPILDHTGSRKRQETENDFIQE